MPRDKRSATKPDPERNQIDSPQDFLHGLPDLTADGLEPDRRVYAETDGLFGDGDGLFDDAGIQSAPPQVILRRSEAGQARRAAEETSDSEYLFVLPTLP